MKKKNNKKKWRTKDCKQKPEAPRNNNDLNDQILEQLSTREVLNHPNSPKNNKPIIGIAQKQVIQDTKSLQIQHNCSTNLKKEPKYNKSNYAQLKKTQETHVSRRIIRIRIEFDPRSTSLCLHALDLVNEVRREADYHSECERVSGN